MPGCGAAPQNATRGAKCGAAEADAARRSQRATTACRGGRGPNRRGALTFFPTTTRFQPSFGPRSGPKHRGLPATGRVWHASCTALLSAGNSGPRQTPGPYTKAGVSDFIRACGRLAPDPHAHGRTLLSGRRPQPYVLPGRGHACPTGRAKPAAGAFSGAESGPRLDWRPGAALLLRIDRQRIGPVVRGRGRSGSPFASVASIGRAPHS